MDLLEKTQVDTIIKKLATRHETSPQVALQAAAILLSKGADNKSAPLTLNTKLMDPNTGANVIITKGDLVNVVLAVTESDNIRKLTRSLAKDLILFSKWLYRIKGFLLPGDLANTIDKRLRANNKPSLSPDEAICAASYATHLQDLPALSEKSDKILALLLEDEEARFGKQKKKVANKQRKKEKRNTPNRKVNNKIAKQKNIKKS